MRCLWVYFTDGIEAAQAACHQQISRLPSGSIELEEALQLSARISFVHRSRNPAPASIMRGVLDNATDLFPNNTTFLSLYLWEEIRMRVHGRIHRLSGRLGGTSIIGGLWSVWAEAVMSSRTFWDAGGGGSERVRAVLDKVVNSSL
jgi:hypothetical protein